MLLAAGYGKRLRPITYETPKCLVSIKGEPLLNIWLRRLKNNNFGPFLINTHFLSSKVKDYLENSKFLADTKLTHEKNLLGTAGTLIKNIDFYNNKDGLFIHADNYSLVNLKEFKNHHENRPKNCLLTMLTFRSQQPSNCGIVTIDKKGIVKSFDEKVLNPPGNLANGAIYILSNQMMKILKNKYDKAMDFSKEILPNFIGKIYTYETKEIFADIGTINEYNKYK
tara:strand:+ start:109 stop:783 length:675 start_codon:yes stop_codon:yes gene_type:complete